MQLAKENSVKMKEVIFTLVLLAPLFCGAESSESSTDCTCIDPITFNCTSIGFTIWPGTCKFENITNYTPDDILDPTLNGSIDLSHNILTEYPSNLHKIFKFVNISNNSLKHLDTDGARDINVLDVSSNQIKNMSLKYFRKLEKLYAANNTLNEDTLDIQNETCDELLELDLSKNTFSGLDRVTNCKNILALDVSNNIVKSIPRDFQSLNRLKNVNFFNNTLRSLNYLPVSIVRLNISKNKLTEVKTSYFAGMEGLEILDLSYNSINTVDEQAFAELTSLKLLDLSSNSLKKVPRLNLCENVRNVSLMNNQITEMDGEIVVELLNSTDREVDVRDNLLTDVILLRKHFISIMDNWGVDVVPVENCTCIDLLSGNATLKFCVEKRTEQDNCWVDFARMTTSTSTISTTTTSPELSSMARITEGNASRTEGVEETGGGDGVVMEAAAFLGLGGAKLSFLGFLLLTFLALLVANWAAGDPVVGERWWEETLRGDRVVS